MADKTWSKLTISLITLSALTLALVLGVEIQTGFVALVIVTALPWIASIVESVDLPGGGSVRLREVREKVERQGEQLNEQERKIGVQQRSYYPTGTVREQLHQQQAAKVVDHLQ